MNACTPARVCDILNDAHRVAPADPSLSLNQRETVMAWLQPMAGDDEIHLHQIREVPVNMGTTTTGEDGRFLGLHLDNWDQLPLAQRDKARNRVCINVGPSPRYLLIVPITVTRFVRNGLTPPDLPHRAFKNHFFSVLGQPTVVKMRIDPGQAYVAPTENVVHDGSSAGQPGAAHVLTARGFFRRLL